MATIHNPTNFDPKDYVVVDYLDNRQPIYTGDRSFGGDSGVESYRQEVAQWQADMARALGSDWPSKVGHCIHCGNGKVRWITAVQHVPTGERVVFGAVCTERLGFSDKMQFKLALLQSRAAARVERARINTIRDEFFAANPAVKQAYIDVTNDIHKQNFFAIDVLSKIDKYGSLSERQVSAVLASMQRDRDYVARKAVEATEVKGDAPTGRTEVTGTVLSTKVQESQWGFVTKMLLKLENNSKVWLTATEDVVRGDVVTVKATWTVSPDDASFAFGKRPVMIQNDHAGTARENTERGRQFGYATV